MFVGQYSHSIDDKSRIVLPSKIRNQLSSPIYISLDFDHCLAIRNEEQFAVISKSYNSLSDFDSNARRLKKVFFSNTIEAEIDKQGRVVISKELLNKVGIIKDVVIIVAFDHVKVFSKEIYEKSELDDENSYEELASHFVNKGE